jgi:arylsulfatase A-like enzyme
VSFTRAYAMTSTTAPSHATLFTGRYAPAHGVPRNGFPLEADAETLAERLAARGHRTAGFVSSFVLSGRFGFDQGFARWDEAFDAETSSLPMKRWEGHEVPGGAFDRAASETTARAVAWLDEAPRGDPFFLFVHYFDAHEPYTPPPEARAALGGPPVTGPRADEIDRYDAEIALVDHALGELLDALAERGLAERTLVIVTSDHGQGLADHDDPYHSVNVYEESVRAVLVVRGPGVAPAGRTSDAPVEPVDLVPTVLDWVEPGAAAGLDLPGRSLLPYLARAEPLDADRPVFVYRQWYPHATVVREAPVEGQQFGIRLGPWKYIEGDRDGRRELYHLERDPGERENRLDAEPEVGADLAARLHAFRVANPRPGGPLPRLSDEDRARLEALGYVE